MSVQGSDARPTPTRNRDKGKSWAASLDAAPHCQEEEQVQTDSPDQDTLTEIETTYGNKIIQDIDENIFRVFTNNVNRLTTPSNGDELL
eukprot:3732135-Ditylum_brightwellii.AAC.1